MKILITENQLDIVINKYIDKMMHSKEIHTYMGDGKTWLNSDGTKFLTIIQDYLFIDRHGDESMLTELKDIFGIGDAAAEKAIQNWVLKNTETTSIKRTIRF